MRIFNKLTNQEYRVLELVAMGKRYSAIARELFISIRTVETHLYRIFDKLGVSCRTEAALYVLNPSLSSTSKVSVFSDDLENEVAYPEA